MKLKVCGIRDKENLESLLEVAPDYVGFIFYKKSKRHVAEFPNVDFPESIKKVGVFVNEDEAVVLDKVKSYQLNAVQLHGDETPEYCQNISEKTIDVEIFKAFSIDENFDFQTIKKYDSVCDLFVFDTKGTERGGTGKKFNWDLLNNYNGETPFLLSGGIRLEDGELIKKFRLTQGAEKCIGLDVNSGFESEPGFKKIEEIKQFKEILP